MAKSREKRKPSLAKVPAGWLSSIEDSQQGLGWSFLIMLASCYGRGFVEGALEKSGRLGFGLEAWQSLLMIFVHLPAFFLALFLLIILALHLVTGEKADRITRALAVGSPIILLPVLVDALFFGGGYQLYYLSSLRQIPEFLVYTFVPWHHLQGASPGIRIEVALGSLAGAWYCWQKTRSWLKAVWGFGLVFLSCLWAGSWPIIIHHLWSVSAGTEALAVNSFGPGGLVPTDTAKYAMAFLFPLSILAALWLRIMDGRLFKVLWRSSRGWRSAHYGGMVLLGFVSGILAVGPAYPQLFSNPFDYLFLPAAVISIVAAFQSAVLINDLFDREADIYTGKPNPLTRNEIDKETAIKCSGLYALLSLSLAAVLGQASLMIVLFVLALSLVYSAPPLRIKRFYPLSILSIALASLGSAWLGFSAFGREHTLALFPGRLAWFIIACFGLSFATKDLNDVEGDRRTGVLTLPVLLGPVRGRRAVSALVMAGYLIGPIILGSYWLLLPAALAGMMTVWIINRPRLNENLVFAVYFIYGAAVLLNLVFRPQLVRSPDSESWGKALSGWEHYQRKDYGPAARLLEEPADRSDDPNLLWSLARSLYGRGDRDRAQRLTERLLARQPLWEKGYHLLARIYRENGQGDEAVAVLRRALNLGLSPAEFHQALGEWLYMLNRFGEAEKSYIQASLMKPDDDGLWARLSLVKLREADTVAALALADKALARNRTNITAAMLKAEIFLSREDYKGSHRILGPATARGYTNPKYLYLWGRTLEGLGSWSEAASAYKRAVAIDDGYQPAWLGLSRCYLARGDVEQSQKARERAIAGQGQSLKGERLGMED